MRGATPIAIAALTISAGHAALAWYVPRLRDQRGKRRLVQRFWTMHGLDAASAPAVAERMREPFVARIPAEPLVDRISRAGRALVASTRFSAAGRPAS